MNQTSFVKAEERKSSLDIIRVTIMLMIVMGHAFVHGKIAENSAVFSVSYFASYTVLAFLYVHVNCFVLLSGYFLSQRNFSTAKVIGLWVQVFFWSVSLFFLAHFLQGTPIPLKELIKSLLPVTQQRYWFITTYLLMYFLLPMLNAAIHAMTRQQHQMILFLYMAVFIVAQNIVFWRNFTSTSPYSPLFFCFLYLIGAYLRKYPIEKKVPWFFIYIGCSLVTCGSRFLITWITLPKFGNAYGETLFWGYCSITNVIGSVALFMVFHNLKVDPNSRIALWSRWLSPLTLGVYLIHDHTDVRGYLWETLSPNQFIGSGYLLVVVLIEAVMIFAVCICMEWIRQRVFNIVGINAAVKKIGNRMDNYLLNMTSRID